MKRILSSTIKNLFKALAYSLVGGLVALIGVFIVYLESRPDLNVWHETILDAEFTADTPARNFADYLAVEERLFEQLEARIYAEIQPEDRDLINRYHRDSLSDPERWPINWNHSFELPTDAPRAGVLLLHGMSDSPYSLRSLGESLHDAGARVVGLRLPGHGTAPSGLIEARWQDMAAAVRLAMLHLREQVGQQPLYIVGYSNGGALAVHYALLALEDDTLPAINGLVLISPAIGVTSVAALAVWQARLGHLLGLDKLAWNSILLEYDPFKYNSFAVNAGDQVFRLTAEIQRQLDALSTTGLLQRLPPILAFQSVVDATVSAPALVEGLFGRLPAGDHELVLFDINRVAEIESLLRRDPNLDITALMSEPEPAFTLSVVSNENEQSQRILVRRKKPGDVQIEEQAIGLSWPHDVYSLSHVALPFAPDDPLYGGKKSEDKATIQLGNIALRGERGVLQISATDMLRLRWNPFYSYVEQRLLEFVGLSALSGSEP